MKTNKKAALQAVPNADHFLTLGKFAHTVICEQYRSVVKQEKKVLADKDPEHLHHMRVGTRRLRTALQVFDRVVELPKAAQVKKLSSLAKVLGRLRDLDVQIAGIQNKYRPHFDRDGQRSVDEVITSMKQQRRKAFAATEDVLTKSDYRKLKSAYETWIDEPQFTVLAQLPLQPLLPDLLNPLLSELLLHPGWLVGSTNLSEQDNEILHDLRKACKHVRYQAEFFMSFYGDDFKNWIKEIKTLQDSLGEVHDSQVLLEVLANHMSEQDTTSHLRDAVQQTQREVMADWEPTRQKYLKPSFRHHLHQMLLEPTLPEPEAKLVVNSHSN